jgi:hypothetical protein
MEIKREHHINFWYVIAAFFAILFIQDLLIRSAIGQCHSVQRISNAAASSKS